MSLKISRILHAGYIFECEGTKIAFDPIFENPFSRNCFAFPNVQFDQQQIQKLHFDAVFISHFHDDHCSLESLNLLNRSTPIYIFCVFEELFSWIRELGFHSVYSLQLEIPIQVGPLTVTPHRALDAEVDSIFQISVGDLNVLNVVDSWIDPDMIKNLSQIAQWDLVFWPFQTMRELEVLAPSRFPVAPNELPQEWIEQLQILNPKFLVSSSCQFIHESWSWYNHAFFPVTYRQFEEEIVHLLPQTKIVRMNPGVSFELKEGRLLPVQPLSWVKPIGEQNVDYDYRPLMKPTSTSKIAKNFPALLYEQSQKIDEFCQNELVKKFAELDLPRDPYFKKSRYWQLSIYDHLGRATHYHYLLNGTKIQILYLNGLSSKLAWVTEIPAYKLYAALESGESLTSMYLRINDFIFDAEIEKEIQYVDIMEDPLIRCLFHGEFGSYQQAQLRNIKSLKPSSQIPISD